MWKVDRRKYATASAQHVVGGGATRALPLCGALVALVASAIALAALVAPASAKEVDRFVGGAQGNGLGEFVNPYDVATNEATGQVYVVEDNRITRLSADGEPELAWGKDVVAGNADDGYEVCVDGQQCQAGSDGAHKGEFQRASGIAVDHDDGSVYVWDARAGNDSADENLRIQKFDADGNFVLMFGRGVNGTTGGDVCTEVSGDTCQAGIDTSDPGGFGNPSVNRPTLAVSPVDGDIFVADPANRRVQRFDSTGTFVEAFGSSAQFGSQQPRHVAVDSRGVVYASDSGSSAEIERYDSAGAHGAPGFLDPIAAPPLLPGGSSATEGLEVRPDPEGDGAAGLDTDHLYVLRDPSTGGTVVQQFDSPGEGAPPATVAATHGSAAGFASVDGLGFNGASGHLYVSLSGGSACDGRCAGYFALDDDGTGTDIGASDPSAANQTARSADLSGTVDPAEGVVRYRFEYSADGATYVPTPVAHLGGATPQQIGASVDDLDANTVYRLRIVVEKVLGPTQVISATSAEAIFLTVAAPPEVVTLPVGSRTDTTATLRGTIDSNGSATTYHFEYGPAGGSFDRQVPAPAASAGVGNVAIPFEQRVAGLVPNSEYHYRLVATNPAGTSTGDPVVFRTAPAQAPQPQLGDRDYELVSPADKVGGVGVGGWRPGLGVIPTTGFSTHVGERFLAMGDFGSMLIGDAAHAFSNDWAFAERASGSVGWRSHSPITHPSRREQFASSINIHALAPDGSRLAWLSNNSTPAFFPEMVADEWRGFHASLLSDWGPRARWEVMGPTDLAQTHDPGGESDGETWDLAFAADGSTAVGVTEIEDQFTPRVAVVRGLAGPGDPTSPAFDDLISGRSIYLADTAGPLADSFAGTGDRHLVNVCTGAVGQDRTTLPAVGGAGELGERECPVAQPGRDARLVSPYGAALRVGDTREPSLGHLRNYVSDDGSRVFFLAPDPLATGVPDGVDAGCQGTDADTLCPPQLYVRQRMADGTVATRWISRAEEGLFGEQEATLTGTVQFEGASADGDRVYFSTDSPLTADDPNGQGAPPPGGVTSGAPSATSWDLYMYDFPDVPGADPAGGRLTRISGGPDGNGDCNSLPGGSDSRATALRFAAPDGSRAYFTCAAPLPGVSDSQNGTVTLPGGTPTDDALANLYVYDETRPDTSRWRFVARVPRADPTGGLACAAAGTHSGSPLVQAGRQSGVTVAGFGPAANCVRGTADGAFVTFWTFGRLTSDDPSSPPSADIYAYDAAAERLVRITALQGGVGGLYPCGDASSVSHLQCYGDGGYDYADNALRTPLPLLTVASDPRVAGDRLAFFQSRSRLVPEDRNDAYDVYQYRNGELSLVTTGVPGADDAFYRGNDSTGLNVYFTTFDRLTWQDYDAVRDIYTARVGGGVPEPDPPATCDVLGHACRAPGRSPAPPLPPESVRPGGGENAAPSIRRRLAVARPGRRARRRAARRGVLTLRVRTNMAGRIRVVVRARLGNRRPGARRARVVGARMVRAERAGAMRVRVRLRKAARRRLRTGRRLVVRVVVNAPGAHARKMRVPLHRRGR